MRLIIVVLAAGTALLAVPATAQSAKPPTTVVARAAHPAPSDAGPSCGGESRMPVLPGNPAGPMPVFRETSGAVQIPNACPVAIQPHGPATAVPAAPPARVIPKGDTP